jgi:cytochrome P450
MVGTNNARVFLGSKASQNKEWVEASTGYVLTTFECIRVLKEWSPIFRPFVFRFGPQRLAIKEQWAKGRAVVATAMQDRQAKKGDHLDNPPSMLDHLSSGKNEWLASNLDAQVLMQMTLVAVGTVTTFASITQALYDLATYPEYIEVLREEVEAAPTDANGLFTKEAPSFMKKLDSFIKESQRRSAPDLCKLLSKYSCHPPCF